MTARIIDRIRIAHITIMIVTGTMTGMIIGITVVAIGIIIGGKTHVMVCKQGSGKPLSCSFFEFKPALDKFYRSGGI